MKLREAIYVITATVMWSVGWPCWTWYQVTAQREETARLQIRMQSNLADAQQHLSTSIDRSTEAVREYMALQR